MFLLWKKSGKEIAVDVSSPFEPSDVFETLWIAVDVSSSFEPHGVFAMFLLMNKLNY